MSDLTSKQIDYIVDILGSYTDLDIPYMREIAENILTKLLSTTPQGHWIRITKGAIKEKYMCSECGRQIEDSEFESLLYIKYPYCHCGARMRER